MTVNLLKLEHSLISFVIFVCSGSAWAYAQDAEPSQPLYSASLTFDNPTPIVDAFANGEKARLVFDTGANATLLFEDSFKFVPARLGENSKNVSGHAFGSTGKANFNDIGEVQIKFGGISFNSAKTYSVPWEQLDIPIETKPYFDGFLPPPLITNKGRENSGIIKMDPFKKKIDFYVSTKGIVEEDWIKLPLKVSSERTFVTQLSVIDPNTGSLTSLNLAIDTGAGQELVLRRDVIHFDLDDQFPADSVGLGGKQKTLEVNPLKVELDRHKVHVKTVVDKNLPYPKDIDGVIGYGFLKRFVTVINATDEYLALNPKNADFTDAEPPARKSRFSGIPNNDWTGFAVIKPREWAKAGINSKDIVTKVEGRHLSKSFMYTGIQSVTKQSLVCWRSHETQIEKCAQLERAVK